MPGFRISEGGVPVSDATVIWLHPPPGQSALTDTAAVNDIHALLTSTGDDLTGRLADVAAIVARTGRPMVRGRDIDVKVSESPVGWPVARVDADDTTVIVRQDPSGSGLLVEITTRTPAERDGLTVSVDGCRLHETYPPGGPAA